VFGWWLSLGHRGHRVTRSGYRQEPAQGGGGGGGGPATAPSLRRAGGQDRARVCPGQVSRFAHPGQRAPKPPSKAAQVAGAKVDSMSPWFRLALAPTLLATGGLIGAGGATVVEGQECSTWRLPGTAALYCAPGLRSVLPGHGRSTPFQPAPEASSALLGQVAGTWVDSTHRHGGIVIVGSLIHRFLVHRRQPLTDRLVMLSESPHPQEHARRVDSWIAGDDPGNRCSALNSTARIGECILNQLSAVGDGEPAMTGELGTSCSLPWQRCV